MPIQYSIIVTKSGLDHIQQQKRRQTAASRSFFVKTGAWLHEGRDDISREAIGGIIAGIIVVIVLAVVAWLA